MTISTFFASMGRKKKQKTTATSLRNAEIKWKLICQKFEIHFTCSPKFTVNWIDTIFERNSADFIQIYSRKMQFKASNKVYSQLGYCSFYKYSKWILKFDCISYKFECIVNVRHLCAQHWITSRLEHFNAFSSIRK